MKFRHYSCQHLFLRYGLVFLYVVSLTIAVQLNSRSSTCFCDSKRLGRVHLSALNYNANGGGSAMTEERIDGYIEDWESLLGNSFNPYRSKRIFPFDDEWEIFLAECRIKAKYNPDNFIDPFWEQTKMEAQAALELEPEAGPQIYQGILSQRSLLEAICTVVSYDIQTELIPATALKNMFLEILTIEDERKIRMDLQAMATRCSSVGNSFEAVLFHNGFHALVCYRVGHRLWQSDRIPLAYYLQSTVSRTYSADIHPACRIGSGIYLRAGAGVVIGETAMVGDDTSILEGVTLGGTGKEKGDRHPKLGRGVIVQHGGAVLGNIRIGDGAIVDAKSIVTKPVPPLAIVSGVPAKVVGYRKLNEEAFDDDLQDHLVEKYLEDWKGLKITDANGRQLL